jgi:hypothetical protein
MDIINQPECRADRSKYFWVGTAVFFTGFFAGLAAVFAFSFVLKTGDLPLTPQQITISIGVGIFWGLLIFSLDRFIVSSIKKSSSFLLQLLQAFPRIILAIIIGLVIAMPLELKIFEKEINLQLVKMQNEELIDNKKTQEAVYQWDFERSEKKFEELKQSIAIKNIEKNEIDAAIAKLPYKTCTGKNKDGSSYSYTCRPGITALKDKLSSKIQEISALQNQINWSFDVTDKITEKISSSQETLENALENWFGLDRRIEALFSLDTIVHWFVMSLFILVELTPVLTKLLLPRWTYDILLDTQEKQASAEAFYRLYDTNATISRRIVENNWGASFLSWSAQSHREWTERMLDNLEINQENIVSKSIPSYLRK